MRFCDGRAAPPFSVLAAFGVSGTPVALEGGQGASWHVGDAVLKPLDLAEDERAWQAEVFASSSCEGFRAAHPLRARDGSLVVDGWRAWEAARRSRRWRRRRRGRFR